MGTLSGQGYCFLCFYFYNTLIGGWLVSLLCRSFGFLNLMLIFSLICISLSLCDSNDISIHKGKPIGGENIFAVSSMVNVFNSYFPFKNAV